jgi:hypothetical protein
MSDIRPAEAIEKLKVALAHEPRNPQALSLLDEAIQGLSIPVTIPGLAAGDQREALPACPLASVTVCSFNQEKYVAECIESVLHQTYTPLEIIISDDGSTDQTPDIIESHINAYKGPHRIVFDKHLTNLGGRARGNWVHSFRRTEGPFIVQFSGDDIMYPDMIEKMVRVWKASGASSVTVNSEYINSRSEMLGRLHRDPTKAIDCSIESLATSGTTDAVFGAGMGFDRQVYEVFPFGKNTPPIHLGSLDLIFSFYAALLNGCAAIAEPLMKYRLHGVQGSLSIAHGLAEDPLQKLIIEEKIWQGHLAHCVYMSDVLDDLAAGLTERYGYLQARLRPMLFEQMVTMGFRLTRTRERLFYDYGISGLTSNGG